MTEPVAPSPGDMALPRVGKRGAPQAFARKLYEILSTESTSVISWNSAGTAFHVRDVYRFSEETLTKYYRHSKFSSFQRQLNLYSFRKIVKGPDAGGYAHPMFHRDRPDDLYHVRRSISGSARYEPSAARAHDVSAASGAASSLAVRKGSGRVSSKTLSGEWTQPRVHKSRAAARRVGKLSVAAVPKRKDSTKETPAKAVSPSSTGTVVEGSAEEVSPWTSGESSESSDGELDSGKESDSDSDSDGEGDGAATEKASVGATDASVVAPAPAREASERKGGLRHRVALFSYGMGSGKAARKARGAGCGDSGGTSEAGGSPDGSMGQDQDGRVGSAGQATTASPTRTSPFNFFRKKFSFMEKVRRRRREGFPAFSSSHEGRAPFVAVACVSRTDVSSASVQRSAPLARLWFDCVGFPCTMHLPRPPHPPPRTHRRGVPSDAS